MTEQFRVLYVDPSEDADSVVETLEAAIPDAAVTTATSVADCLDRLDAPVDCVVSEHDLPDGDALELLEQVRERRSGLPFLLYTATNAASLVDELLSAAATDYVHRAGDASPLVLARRVEAAAADRRPLDSRIEEFRTVMESAADVVVTIDDESTVRYVNPAVEDVFGYEPDELVGESLTTLMSPEMAERHRDAVQRYLRTGERTLDWSRLELHGRHRDGSEIPLGVSFGEFEHEGEHFFTGIVRDVTERKELEAQLREERNLTERIIDTSPIGILVADADGEFTLANRRAEEILGRTRAEIVTLSYDDSVWELTDTDGRPLRENEMPVHRITEAEEPIYDIDIGVTKPSGERVLLSVNGAPLRDGDGEQTGTVLTLDDVTEQRRIETELSEVFGRVTDAFFALDDEWRFTYVNEQGEALLDRSEAELIGQNVWEEFPEARESVFEERYREAMATQEPVTFEELFPPLDAWFAVQAYPSETGLSVYFRDITERKEHSMQLRALNEVSRDLITTEDAETVADVVTDAADATLNFPFATVALYDGERGTLVPRARTADDELDADGVLGGGDESVVWRAFVDGELAVHGQLNTATPLRSAIVVPLGNHGVLAVGATEPNAFDEEDVALVRILGADAQAALDHAQRQAELRERDERLEERNEQLERLARLNEVMRNIDRTLVRASNREEIEREVCQRLASAEPYRLAWIGEHDAVTQSVQPREWASAEEGELQEILITMDDESIEGPAARAVRTHEPQATPNVLTDASFDPWREAAMSQGYQSAISVPLVYEESLYGVLNVYADRPGVFDEQEQAVLAELGDTIAYAINALESKRALVSDTVSELEFRTIDEQLAFVRVTRKLDGEFELDNVVPRSDGSLHIFFTTRGAPVEEILAFAEESDAVTDVTHVSEHDDENLFEGTLTDDSFIATILDHGATPRTITADADGGRIVVDLPGDRDVRQFVELVQSIGSDTELVARRERERDVQTRVGFRTALTEQLTERQQEVLRTAYASGFFESPRRHTGEEIGASLGVSQPTFNHHLRASQRKLFELLFEE